MIQMFFTNNILKQNVKINYKIIMNDTTHKKGIYNPQKIFKNKKKLDCLHQNQKTDYHVANCLVGNEWTARRGDASEFWLQWKVVVRQRNIMTEIISYRTTKHMIFLSLHCVANVLHDNEGEAG